MNPEALLAALRRLLAGSARQEEPCNKPPIPLLEGVERRYIGRPVELRAAREGSKGPGVMVGYAAVFNTASQDLGGFLEWIDPGAFAAVLKDDCRCLRNHEADNLLGRSSAGTLRLEQDTVGLRYECDLPDTTAGRDTAESIRRGDLTGCSFEFRVDPEGEAWDFSGPMPLRKIRRYSRLYDVGPVTYPAYDATRVDMRSFDAARAAQDLARARSERIAHELSQAKARLRLAEAELVSSPTL
jgi:HK97 family phage prohead protease